MTILKKLMYVLVLILSVLSAFSQKKASLPPGIDAYIEKVLKTFEVPGAAVAIVQNGKVLMSKGYGIKRLGGDEPVDANTLFLIASNSKAFTATALAMLVEEGKLKWEDPVIDHLPWFRMSDPYVTMHLTIRDLLVHHSGLPAYAGDVLLFPPSELSRREILMKLNHVPLVHDFRSVYAYDNILYLAAGEVIAKVSGMSWEDFVKTRIFDKVGMTQSISRFSDLKSKTNYATSHVRSADSVRPVDRFMEINIGDAGNPAGGIVSCANDMARWLITQLDSGRTPSNDRIFTPKSTNELWKIVRPMPISRVPEDLKPSQQEFWGYALGFRVYNYRQYKVIGHGGLLTGFVSQIAMVPELGLGVAVLTNQQTNNAFWSIIYQVLDHYMQNKPHDWISAYKRNSDSMLAERKMRAKRVQFSRDSSAKPSLPLHRYTGKFTEYFLGEISITKEPSGLVMQFKNSKHFVADLEYYQHNTFRARFRGLDFRGDAFLSFLMNHDGTIEEIKMKVPDPNSPLDFDNMVLSPMKEKITDTIQLRKAITQEFSRHPEGRFAVAFRDLSTGERFFINEK